MDTNMKAQLAYFAILFVFLGYQIAPIATEWHPEGVMPLEIQEEAQCPTWDEYRKGHTLRQYMAVIAKCP